MIPTSQDQTTSIDSSLSDPHRSHSSKIFKSNKFTQIAFDSNKPSRGRGLFLNTKLNSTVKPGTTLLSLSPYVAVLDTSSLSSRCSCCFLERQDFNNIDQSFNSSSTNSRFIRRCGKCKVIAYCGADCQQLDWASHKSECTALVNYGNLIEEVIKANQKSKSRSSLIGNQAGLKDSFGLGGDEIDNDPQFISRIPSATIRALARLIWKKPREEKFNPDWWTGLSELQNHLNDYTPTQKESLMQLSITLSRYIGNQTLLAVFDSASALLPFCSRFIDNSFTLTSTTFDQIGAVFVPPASFINHSCDPNAVVVFPEGGEGAGNKAGKEWVRVIAIKHIKPGEEIVTSYVDSAGTRQERQNELMKRYRFVCDCALCKSDSNDQVDPREALKCPKCTNWFSIDRNLNCLDAGPSSNKKTVRKEITCSHCGFSRLIDVEGQRSAIKKSGKTLDPIKEPAKAAYYTEKATDWFQSKLSPFTFGPGFYPILDLRRMRMTSYLIRPHKNHIKQATKDLQQIILGVHQVYGVGHPSSIVTRSIVSKLYGFVWSSNLDENDNIAEEDKSKLKEIEENRRHQTSIPPPSSSINQKIKLELQILENMKVYQLSALEECLIGFGSINGGGRLGRSISNSIELTDREILGRRKILQSCTS